MFISTAGDPSEEDTSKIADIIKALLDFSTALLNLLIAVIALKSSKGE